MTNDDSSTDLAWIARNAALRREMDLPPYEPPRFSDGQYVHTIVRPLEAAFECRISFTGVNTTYPDAWEIRVDGTPVCSIDRRRDSNGNTVFEMEATQFREIVRAYLSKPS